MSGTRRPAWLRYAVAVFIVALCAKLLKLPLVQTPNTAVMLFFLGILFSAWYGGLGPGLVTTSLIALLTLPPSFTFSRVVRLALFLSCGVTISALLEALHRALWRAEVANRAKDDFLATLSHELRTPLTPVLAEASALLADPQTPPALRRVLELTQSYVALEARLIDDLLDVTRIGRGELMLEREDVDAHALARRAVELCREQIQGSGLRSELDLSAVSHHVRVDPARIQQVFWNLVRNAVKFTPPGGTLAVRSRNTTGPSGTHLIIEVSDTGIGIDPHQLPLIFAAFGKGKLAGPRQFGGLGLGLAISRSVIEAHGGRLVVSSPGKNLGATFTVALNAVSAPETKPVTLSDDGPREPEVPSSRILLVEDDVGTVRVLARLLRVSGFDVTTAGSVNEAWDAAQGREFDLVVSDIGLPDGTGWDLMPRLRKRGITRGIALTGFGLEDDVRRSREAGFSLHLTKPVDFPKLEAAIRQTALSSA